jgi:hypothetical protein
MSQNDGSKNTLSIIASLVAAYLMVGLILVYILSTRCGNALFATDSNKYLSALNIVLYWPFYLIRMGIHWHCTGYY